ncbi:hypothetical protein CCAN11_230002 [Capnocytophaga canimorsus]|uniref:Uncharacterized protein n=1 Tax=Capnocytophaga canimorsus TaxID=28188 RepID=A0A0B7IN13_9FLAO|nr:hypothetical protein CCAN11_230002 [Capnocytophaga canimorsus]
MGNSEGRKWLQSLFKDWAEKDLTNLVRHFRNNP